MHKTTDLGAAIAGLNVGVTTSARDKGAAKLTAIHRELMAGMPAGGQSEVRVLLATLDPGDTTPFHSHRFPVTVFMLEGTFTLDLEGRAPVNVNVGEVFVEPAHVRMTGHNYSSETPARMVLFYVSDPDTPFADPAA
jgi:quercetin dioxygenase-like cupin family protein